MTHYTTTGFRESYARLPEAVQRKADRHYELLQTDPRYPFLRLKCIGRLWSVRAGSGYRAIAADVPDGSVWFWTGPHDEYEPDSLDGSAPPR